MKNSKALYAGLIVAGIMLSLAYFATVDENATPQPGPQPDDAPRPATTLKKTHSIEATKPASGQQDPLAGAVNERFADKPEIQKAWVSRGQNIVLKNHPTADSANFSGTFFHRGFKDRAVTCGEVQFLANGEIIAGYQRFIYSGGQSTHLETDITNFHLLWDKLCVQTYNK
ncbi:MAG: hypothetical protein ACE5FQ_03015 [Thiogranum sp.]